MLRFNPKQVRAGKSITYLAALALMLTACGSAATDSTSAAPSAVASSAGPKAWSEDEITYLNAITDADLAASVYLSSTNYVEIGNTVCNGLKQDILLDELLSALATSGSQNGLNVMQRTEFSLITSAAAVLYLCPDQKDKYKRAS